MPSFKTDTDELGRIETTLRGFVRELDDASAELRSPDVHAAGEPSLEGSLYDFVAEWTNGLVETQTKLSEIAERLGVAKSVYESSEQEIADHMSATQCVE